MTKNKKVVSMLVSALVLILSVFTGAVSLVFAVEKPDYEIKISPFQNELGTVKPGETYNGEFKVKNSGTQEFEFEVSFAPYSVANVQYNADYSTKTQFNEIADWIEVDAQSGILQGGEEQVIHYTIDIPEDVHGGAQMGAILVAMRTPDTEVSGNSIETIRQLSYIIFGNVDGEVTQTGKILENKVPSFLFNPPIVATSLVENTGNVYTVATYKLQVFPLFSDEEVYTNEEIPENNLVFPETKRYNEMKWEGAPQLGIFKVRSTVKIFDEENVTEKIVFLCPVWFLFVVLLLIFCIIFWIASRAMRRKKEA